MNGSRRIKKVIAVLTALALSAGMLLLLAGCGGDGGGATHAPDNTGPLPTGSGTDATPMVKEGNVALGCPVTFLNVELPQGGELTDGDRETGFHGTINYRKSMSTQITVDLGGITALNAALDALAEKMADGVENGEYASFMKDRSEIKSFGMTRDPNGVVSFYYDLVDVGNLAEHMEAFYPKEAAAVKAALGAAVADKYANIDDAAGMTLYYPYKNKGQFEQLNEYYASFLKTEGYSRFLDAAGEYFLKSKSWDWNLGEPKDQGDEYTLQLTHEQLDNMTEATYTVLTSNGIFGGYKPIMENCKIEPDKNGVLHLDKNVQLAVLRNGEQAAILRAVEVESDRKRKVYDTKGISLRSDVLYVNRINDLEAADVTIRLSKDKKSGEVQIQNIELEDNSSGIAGGKNSVDLMNWEGLAVLTGPDLIVPARDESGRIRPYEEWTRPGSTTWSAVPVSSEVEQLVFVAGVGMDGLNGKLAMREGARLVEHDGIDLCQDVEIVGTLDEDALTRGTANATKEGQWYADDQCART